MFPLINKRETGINLRRIMDLREITPKDVQEYLGLGCVQSVYRWLDGINMPNMTSIELQLCDIQGRLFKLSLQRGIIRKK